MGNQQLIYIQEEDDNIAKKINKKEIENRIKSRFPEESFSIIQYESLGKPGIIKCNTCGTEIKVSKFSNFFAKNKKFGCKQCNGLWKNRERKLKEVKEYYDILDSFVKETHTYYKVKCKQCGHIRTTTLKNLITHLNCGCVTGTFRSRTSEEFIKQVNKNSIQGKYELLSEYKDQTTKVLLRHSCGFIWKVRPSDIIKGRSFCPKCSHKESSGERKIRKFLEKNNISFQQEKRLDNSLLRFDFYLENEKQKIAIEYNGKQHYEEIKKFTTTLEEQQERDKRKNEYCKNNKIILYNIPYYYSDEELEKTLINIINKFNDYPERE